MGPFNHSIVLFVSAGYDSPPTGIFLEYPRFTSPQNPIYSFRVVQVQCKQNYGSCVATLRFSLKNYLVFPRFGRGNAEQLAVQVTSLSTRAHDECMHYFGGGSVSQY